MENIRRGWSSNRFHAEEEAKPVSKFEQTVRTLSRVKWKNVAIALVILAGFGYGIVSMASDVISAYPEWQEERNAKYVAKEIAKYEQVEVVVQKGDTAWTIQQRLTPNEHDLRHPLYLAEEINGEINWGHLIPGQKLVFLKEK